MTLSNQEGILKIPDFRDNVESVTIITSNQFKKGGFNGDEDTASFILSAITTIFDEEVSDPESEPDPNQMARPEDYGLTEGDLIRAKGDLDIFIINQFGYKRLFLNPAIFNMYGHLGGWDDVKTVSIETRDAFITSGLYKYINDEKVYYMNVTGGDTGTLHWLNISGDDFLSQKGDVNSIFIINKHDFGRLPLRAGINTYDANQVHYPEPTDLLNREVVGITARAMIIIGVIAVWWLPQPEDRVGDDPVGPFVGFGESLVECRRPL